MSESTPTRIVTILAETKYDWVYAERLAAAVSRHSSLALDIWTDRPERSAQGACTHALPQGLGIHGWWWKLWLFSPEARQQLGGAHLLWLDLDTAITGDLDGLIAEARDLDHFLALRSVLPPSRLGSGVMWIPATMGTTIWDRWNAKGRPQDSIFGDQRWIQECVEKGAEPHPTAYWQDVWPGRLLSYKCEVQKGHARDDATIVYFHGTPRPHQLPADEPLRRIWEGADLERTAT